MLCNIIIILPSAPSTVRQKQTSLKSLRKSNENVSQKIVSLFPTSNVQLKRASSFIFGRVQMHNETDKSFGINQFFLNTKNQIDLIEIL